jgi:PAS domain S-box-containing protein
MIFDYFRFWRNSKVKSAAQRKQPATEGVLPQFEVVHSHTVPLMPGEQSALPPRTGLPPSVLLTVIEHFPDGFLFLDHRWRFRYVNENGARLLRSKVEELLNRTVCDVLPAISDSEFARHLLAVQATGQAASFEAYYLHLNATFKCYCLPVEGGVGVLFSDTSQNRKTIQRLRKSEAESRRLAAIVEQCNDFVGMCTKSGVPIYINRAGREMVGLEPGEDLSQRHFLSFFAPECHQAMTTQGIPALRHHGKWKGEVQFKNGKTGQHIPSHWNVFVIEDPDGEHPEVWATVSPDLSEQKRMEAALRLSERMAQQANRAKSEFLANMSHEIRTPMAAVLGYADILLEHLEDPDDRASIQIIKRNGEHLLELINDILDLSRIEAGKLQVELEELELIPFIRDIQSLMCIRAAEKQLPFSVRFDGRVPSTITSDATRLRQILINLLGNAIKFTENGSVQLVVRYCDHPQHWLEFEVVDTGIGISHEQLERLFQPFTQGDNSVTRSFGGSGLGLAISKRLVEMLHGQLSVRSQMGKGSSFYVGIPLQAANLQLIQADSTDETAERDQPSGCRRLNCSALVVDDRRDVRYISQHFLEQAGAQVQTAEDGQRAIQMAVAALQKGRPFDIIIMDMQMPVLDGYQAARRLRELGIEKPIIALTADAMKGDREKCLAAGCDDYLSKPIEHLAFLDLVARYTLDLTRDDLQHRRRRLASSPGMQ